MGSEAGDGRVGWMDGTVTNLGLDLNGIGGGGNGSDGGGSGE
jgi:hypothetical protein